MGHFRSRHAAIGKHPGPVLRTTHLRYTAPVGAPQSVPDDQAVNDGQSLPVDGGTISPGTVDIGTFVPTVRPVAIFDTVADLPALPDILYPVGATAIVLDTGTVYKNVADVWVAGVGAVAGGIESVAVLPTLPDASYPSGSVVYYSVDGKLYRNISGTWSKAVDGGDITAETVTADSIAAGAITAAKIDANAVTANKLEALLVLGTMLVAGALDEQHVEIDGTGIILYDADDEPVVYIPTDPDLPVFVKGNVIAGTLLTQEGAEFRGPTSLASGATLTAQGSVAAPGSAPVLASGWETFELDDDATRGLSYSAVGGAGGATPVYYALGGSGNDTLTEYLVSDGSVNRTASLGFTGTVHGVCRHGLYLYVYGADFGPAYKVRRYLASTLALDTTYAAVSLPVASVSGGSIASDGTNIYIALSENIGREIKWNKYDSAMVKVGATISTGYSSSGSYVPAGNAYGTFDFGAARMIVVGSDGTAHVFTSTGAHQTNECFPQSATSATGVAWDGTRFLTAYNSSTITHHSTWTWTTESAKYWVAYSWYDPDATVHETELGPRASITMGRRQRLSVSNAAIPGAGGADDPDNVRIYMDRNATELAPGAYHLQATDALTTRHLTTFATGGAADPTTNDFPAAAPASIKSAGGEWELSGDGTIPAFGAATAYSPAVNNSGSATWTTRSARYYRFGAMVLFDIELVVNAAGAGGGAISIELPTAVGGLNQICTGFAQGFTTFADGPVVGLLNSGAAVVAAVRDVADVTLNRSHYSGGAVLRLSGWYVEA